MSFEQTRIFSGMVKWDGIAGFHKYIGGSYELYKDEKDGSIFYKDSTGDLKVWCAGSRLDAHLMRLYQVCGENTVKIIK